MNASTTDFEALARAICAKRRFAYIERIGAGSFKQSFRVENAGAELALKILVSGGIDRLVREVRAVSRCVHPNIGRLVEVQTETTSSGNVIYFLEPYLAGGTLAGRLKVNGTLPLIQVRAFARQLSSALALLAKLDLVHRDIKPDNILFDGDPDVPILVDFGLVRDLSAESLTQSHMARGPGTPMFSPPEQLNNQKELIDWRADQFALGVTLAYCAFGFHPYSESSDTDDQIVERVAHYGGQSARFVDAATKVGLESIITMTRLFPVQRYCFTAQLDGAWA